MFEDTEQNLTIYSTNCNLSTIVKMKQYMAFNLISM